MKRTKLQRKTPLEAKTPISRGKIGSRPRGGQKGHWRYQKDTMEEVVLDYLGRICVYCGSIEKLHIHHVIPIGRGGKNQMSNLEITCMDCHHKIHRVWDEHFPVVRLSQSVCPHCKNPIQKTTKEDFYWCSSCDCIIRKP